MFDLSRILEALKEIKPAILPLIMGFGGVMIVRLVMRTMGASF